MSDNKVSVEEALVKLYDLSWMIGVYVDGIFNR